ncbi:hypothetical protein [Streptomyces sp. AC555_RSS877]|uniref:hypothetical protein n=1 Tax=Streptomyces sp. AC555_RSS877 TaxID=2823688 RepID=UPI001C278A2E|nr:hypothetical protein [Streptomyces sp. AC555_RSS877]
MTSTTLVPLLGVVLGGLVSTLAQYSSGCASERAEVRRSARERAEARRAERVTHLVDFLAAVQEAERVAVDRYHHNLADDQWQARAKESIDRMWVAQKTIHMLCESEVNEAARRLASDVQGVIRKGPGDPAEPQDEKVWAYIRPSRRAFLDVVRDHLA